MKCPKCESLLEEECIGWSMDDENNYIEIDVECKTCGDFFARIEPHDLIACE